MQHSVDYKLRPIREMKDKKMFRSLMLAIIVALFALTASPVFAENSAFSVLF